MNNSCTINGSTFPHEVGHFFSMLHTHGPINNVLTTELVNGSNCDTDGDLLCDTPADPQLSSQNVTPSCNYNGTAPDTSGGGFDANGDAFNPDPNNIMSYSRKDCRTIFSANQYARIYASFQTSRNYFSCPSFSVDFIADNTSTCQNSLTVSFTDNSNGATSWEWDFNGDGIIDDFTQNPSFTYSSAGNYDVVLYISDGTNTISRNKTNYINVGTDDDLPVNENFDSIFAVSDINWTTNDVNGNGFNWFIREGSTPSPATGPNTDNSGSGKYMYTEASFGPVINDVAELTSNCIEINSNDAQLEFAFHMYGSGMGSLHVDIDAGSGFVTDVTPAIVGQQQANQSDAYLTRQIDLSGYANQIIIIKFRAVMGSNFRSDIAIDDVSITGTLANTYTFSNGWTPSDPVSTPSSNIDNIEILNGIASISGLLNGNNLLVASGATLEIAAPASGLPVDATVLNIAGDITNEGNITFKSDTNGSAQFDEFTGTISGSGDVTVERYIPAFDNINGTNLGRAFRFLTSTVSTSNTIFDNWQQGGLNPGDAGYEDNVGTHITGSTTGANGLDATETGNPSMFTFDNSTVQDWVAITSTNNASTNNLAAGRAYLTMIRGDRSIDLTNSNPPPTNTTLKATGDLLIGQVDYATAVDAMATTAGHFSLVANPYQAVVNYVDVDRINLTNKIYVWDASINIRGGYVTVDFSDPSNIFNNVLSSSDASNFLAPGQSFFVQNDGTGNGALTFDENDKATTSTQVSVFSTNTDFTIQSSLYKTSDLQNGNGVSDGLVLVFNNNYTTPADYEDAVKFTNPDENYAIINNGLRSIDKQAMPTIGHEIDLSITNYRESNYSLTFDMENKSEDLGVFLNDNYLDSQAELTNDFVYDFSIDENIPESVASNRFSLSFDNSTLGLDENVFGDGFSLYPNPTQDGRFSIKTNNLNNDEVSVKLYSILGQEVFSKTLTAENNGEIDVNASSLSAGVYMVELMQNEQKFFSKLIVE